MQSFATLIIYSNSLSQAINVNLFYACVKDLQLVFIIALVLK